VKRVLRIAFDGPIFIYNLILVLVSPIVLILKATRYFRKGWKREYDMARWFIPLPKGAPSTPRVVLIGTGWGEMRLIELLDVALKTQNPEIQIIWVLRDREAIETVQRENPDQAITWLPFDFAIPVWFWLHKIRPDVVVFTEKFWFPNLVRGCKNCGAQIMVMNARTRAHDKSRYKIFEQWHRHIAGSFDAMVFQSEEDQNRARGVLASRTQTHVAGNLKFALRPAINESKTESLARWLEVGSIPLFGAGSVEESDVDFVFAAFEKVRASHNCKLLVTPRRFHYVPEILAAARAKNWTVNVRSQSIPASVQADIYILDSMGELASAYQFCRAAFIGGTLKSGAGHNIVEPLVFGIPVSYGPNRGFFESVQIAAENAGVGFRLKTSEELAAHWNGVLEDATITDSVKIRAAKLLEEQSDALEVNAGVLRELIERAS